MLRFRLAHLAGWEQRESSVAAKVLAAMGPTQGQRKQWLSGLRGAFFGLDRFQVGRKKKHRRGVKMPCLVQDRHFRR